ncbi:23S rRNA (adenine(2030)-N(6))-methyltransferase RlmJ [Sagittula salina]|uniref:Ribosomal RNA large subunit methyltransferase J n=1 Tax=Sagittula salina TaxID=2820268 RepID=A0A940MKW2_9RHOB|nr:23S rRNA (adenine(2030)-N(6))-methyltransferase RlmJ [Sagittula salina]MBP0481224.1 23S rRNA (adenine(2030)-N(6))-methyltransferase RlmJ [Sagittula salina]
MLSYQHIYHAGNLADVHKHAALAWTLNYLTQKPKPISYLETHAGRALYDLSSTEALKTGEAKQGVSRLLKALPTDHPYLRVVDSIRNTHGPNAYPGSPLIARTLLRDSDTLHLAELHPQENAALRANLRGRKVHVHQQDGYEMAISLAPPEPRRGMLLIDPSWEVKADYQTLPRTVASIARKWNVGIIMIWYPILTDAPHTPMLAALQQAHPEGLRHEVRFPPAREGHRMVGSGLFTINPPWGLEAELQHLSKTLFSSLKS